MLSSDCMAYTYIRDLGNTKKWTDHHRSMYCQSSLPKSPRHFQSQLRARDTPAGSGQPLASFSKGLSFVVSLFGGLYCMTSKAKRLEVVSIVITFWKRDNMVHQHGRRHPAGLGTMPAKWFSGKGCVADAPPALVVTALAPMGPGPWQVVGQPRSALCEQVPTGATP